MEAELKKKIYEVITIYFKKEKDSQLSEFHSYSFGCRAVSPGGAVFPVRYLVEYSVKENSITLKPGFKIVEEKDFVEIEYGDFQAGIGRRIISKIERIQRIMSIRDTNLPAELEDKVVASFNAPSESSVSIDIYLTNKSDTGEVIAWKMSGGATLVKISADKDDEEINIHNFEVLLVKKYWDMIINELFSYNLVPEGRQWQILQRPVTAQEANDFINSCE